LTMEFAHWDALDEISVREKMTIERIVSTLTGLDRVPRRGVRARSVLRLSVLRLAGQFMCPSWAT
jgi:predicted DNA-binding ribbon-helix-helix protein